MKVSVKMVGVVIVAIAMVAVLVGCPKQPSETAMSRPPKPRAVAPEGEAAAPVGEPQTLADVWTKLNANESYALTMTMPDGEVVTQLVKLEDGKPVKMRMNAPEGSGFVVMDMKEQVMYMCTLEENMAMKMDMAGAAGEGGAASDMAEMTFGPGSIQSDVELKTSETLDGVECWVVETTTKGGDEDTAAKIWVNKATGLLVQMEADGDTIKMEYSRFNEIADSEFEMPEGMEVTDMSKMGEATGGETAP